MKKILLLFLAFTIAMEVNAQETRPTERKVPVIERENPESAQHGRQVSNMAKTKEGGREKGISISSAARRSSLPNPGNVNREERSREKYNERQSRPERPTDVPREAQVTRPERPVSPTPAQRPSTQVPNARPTPPVVRPTRPVPTRPLEPTRPTIRPGG